MEAVLGKYTARKSHFTYGLLLKEQNQEMTVQQCHQKHWRDTVGLMETCTGTTTLARLHQPHHVTHDSQIRWTDHGNWHQSVTWLQHAAQPRCNISTTTWQPPQSQRKLAALPRVPGARRVPGKFITMLIFFYPGTRTRKITAYVQATFV